MFSYFEKLINPFAETTVSRPPTATFPFIWHFIEPVKGVLLITFLLSGIAGVCELYLYAYLGQILDWMNNGSREQFLAEHGAMLALMVFVVGILRPVSLIASRCLISLAITPGLTANIRMSNHRYVLRQSMDFFQNDFAGRISQKVLQTGHSVREIVLNLIDGVWLLVIYLIGIVAMLVSVNAVLLIPVAAWLIGYCGVVLVLIPPVRSKSTQLSEANSAMTGRIVDSYTNMQSVKLFAHHELEEKFAATAMQRHLKSFQMLMRAIISMTLTLTILNTVLVLGMAGISIWLWLQHGISVGEIAVANGLIIRLNQMSGWVLRTLTSLFENIGTLENGIETIAKPTLIQDAQDAKQLQVHNGHVVFDNISFHYRTPPSILASNADKTTDSTGSSAPLVSVIEDCKLNITAGEKIGLVGRSGAGKSTLINLLLRFHEIEHGVISIDGQDIRGVTQQSLRSNIGVVTQDPSLLHRSVRDNIQYGRADATEEEIIAAAEQAEAMSFILNLVDKQGRRGLDATVGERGVKLSGGQRQRIAIARVLLKNAPILILDEATSALDSEVELAIQAQLTHLMQGKTVLAVAHRLSTIAALDRLVVLDEGRIMETGTHTELLAKDGLYSRLWKRQSGGFLGL